MGLLSGQKMELVPMLEEAIERLQIGISTYLIDDYSIRLKPQPPDDAVHLAECVLCYAMTINPINEPARLYERTHDNLIRKEAIELVANVEVSKALSYLYAAIILLLAIRTKDPLSELSAPVITRASELSFIIPGTYDICGSGDAAECIKAISAFALVYLQRSLKEKEAK